MKSVLPGVAYVVVRVLEISSKEIYTIYPHHQIKIPSQMINDGEMIMTLENEKYIKGYAQRASYKPLHEKCIAKEAEIKQTIQITVIK